MDNKRRSLDSVPLSARFHPTPSKRLEFIPGQMILKIKEDPLKATVGTLKGGGARLAARVASAMPESVSGPLDYLEANAGLKQVTPLFAKDAKPKLAGLNAARAAAITSVADSPNEDLRGYTLISVDPKKVTPGLMRKVNASSAIQFAEQMPARWITKPTKAIPDPLARQALWGLNTIGWFDADNPPQAQIGKTKVAILDSGIDETHPDLKDLLVSYNHDGSGAEDIIGHGTHVAGIIAAVTNNGIGQSGPAACQLSVWKIFGDTPTNGDFYVDGEMYLRALGLVPNTGCTVVNLSIGGTEKSQTEAHLFGRLRDRAIITIAAMGNEYEEGNPVEFPGAYEGVLAVGAISSDMRRASFSNTGKHIWVVAPGQGILSTVPMKASRYRTETKYASWDGTSMAAPHVSGAVALHRAKNPNTTFVQVANALKRSAKPLPEMKKKKFTTELGHGVVYLPALL
jgi:subtilisin family serine protease